MSGGLGDEPTVSGGVEPRGRVGRTGSADAPAAAGSRPASEPASLVDPDSRHSLKAARNASMAATGSPDAAASRPTTPM
jgi:hypothetical protein